MDSTARPTTEATCRLVVTPESLLAAFATVPDPRRAASVDYPLASILAMSVAALLCAQTSILAIAEWGARQPADLLHTLGFAGAETPCQSTVHRLFRKLDPRALSAALTAALASAAGPRSQARGSQGIALDGKAQRGRLQYEEGGAPIHALVAFCQEHSVVLASEPVAHGQDKEEAELTVAPALIARINWRGRVLTGDALFCQRDLCQQVLDAGGDYLLSVKANQPTLCAALRLLFDPGWDVPLVDRREARTVDKGHGRWGEVRHLIASTDLEGYGDWPGMAQVFRIERRWQEGGERKRQVRYGITSLPPSVGPPQRLLRLKRRHWLIENQGHRSKDVNLGEDASLLHAGHGPTVVALLRDVALSVLRAAGCFTIAAQLRYHSQYPDQAVALITAPLPTRA
jgi:predicted transposase YbfD/YdcC